LDSFGTETPVKLKIGTNVREADPLLHSHYHSLYSQESIIADRTPDHLFCPAILKSGLEETLADD